MDLNAESTYTLPLFRNSSIDRQMDKGFLQEVLTEMVQQGKASWIKSKTVVLLYWRSPNEWAQEIYRYVNASGGIGSIYTVYDLIEGDDTIKEAFHGIPESVTRTAIAELEQSGKAHLIANPEAPFFENGIKFF